MIGQTISHIGPDKAMGSSPDASARAPGVAMIEPGLNLIPLTPDSSQPVRLETSSQERLQVRAGSIFGPFSP